MTLSWTIMALTRGLRQNSGFNGSNWQIVGGPPPTNMPQADGDQGYGNKSASADKASNVSEAQEHQPAKVADQSLGDQTASDPVEPYTPGSWDDPNCVAGCLDPKVLNAIGINPQFSDPAPNPNKGLAPEQLSLDQLDAQVAANKQKIALQMSADAALPTSPEPGQGKLGSIFGVTACGTERCYGGSFVIDGGIHAYVIDPNGSTGTPQISFSAQIGVNPRSVANGDSITTTVPLLFGSETAVTYSDGGVAYGVSYGTPGVSFTRGVHVGTILPTSP